MELDEEEMIYKQRYAGEYEKNMLGHHRRIFIGLPGGIADPGRSIRRG